MNRKLRCVFVAILLITMLTFCSCVSAEAIPSGLANSFYEYSGECGEHASWQYVNHTLVISGYGPMESYASLNVHAPWYDIKEDIWQIIIEDGITTISDSAFMDFSSLEEITVAESVTVIGSHAFNGCGSLASIILPGSLTEIGFGAFYCCSSISEMVIPKNVKSIGQSAFGGCSRMTKVSFSSEIELIDTDAFDYCNALTDVYYDGDYDTITNIMIAQGNNRIKTALWHCNDLTAHLTATASGDCGANVHWRLIDDTLSISGEGPMTNFRGLNSHAPWYDWKDGITSVYVESGITTIGNYAFSDFGNVIDVELPDTITYIGSYAFSSCNMLTEIQFPANLKTIEFGGFYCCGKLQSASLPDGMTTIGQYAFAGCSSLGSVSIPVSLSLVNNKAFDYCSLLTDVFYSGNYENIESITIEQGNTSFKKALWHCADKTDYIKMKLDGICGEDARWSFADGVLTISGTGIMESYRGLNEHAPWYDCKDEITSVVIQPGITTIGDYSFIDCRKIESVVIPDGIITIGVHAFSSCSQLKDVALPDSVEKINFAAFYCCSSITSMTIPERVVYIGQNAFAGCSRMTSIRLPLSLASIDLDAFASCRSLTDVYYAGNYEQAHSIQINTGSSDLLNAEWHYNSLSIDFDTLEDVLYLPQSIVDICDEAFTHTQAQVIVIPDGCSSIGNRAFANMSKLKYVVIPASVSSIADDAFAQDQGITIIGEIQSEAESFAYAHGFRFAQR